MKLPRPFWVALLICAYYLSTDLATANVNSQFAYMAVGTSETAGYGLTPGAAYPALVSQRCHWRPKINAEVGGSVLLLPDREFRGIVSIFWSPDFAVFATAARESERLREYLHHSSALHVFVLVPPELPKMTAFRGTKANVLREDQSARQRIESRKSRRITVISLPVPQRTETLDGLHPSERGQREIASLLAQQAIKEGLCPARQRSPQS